MEITAVVPKLLLQIISSAFQRCRLAEDLCRLSVLLDQSTERDPPITCISIAHTGIGCNVEEFQDLRCPREFNGAKIWGLNDFRIVEMGYSPSRQLVSFVPLIDSFGYRPESLLMPLIALISPGFAYKFNGGTYTFLSSIRSSPQSYRILLSHLKNHCGTCYCSSLILLHCADGSAGFSDDEVYYYHINLDEYISNKRLKRQPSHAKNGAKFSGTEVSLCVFGSMDVLVAPIIGFFQKMLVLQIPNVTMDLMVKQGASPGTQTQYIFTVNADKTPCFTASNLERLKSGLEDYVLRHGNYLDTMCDYCFSDREHLKVGSGTVCHEEKQKRAGGTMEVVIVICDLLETTQHCSISCDGKTQVLYFDNYSPSPIPRFALSALKKIDWKSYGLILANVNDQDGHVFLEWENFPSYVQIQIALHWYHNQYPARQKNGPGINLVKKGIKNALDDLKAKNEGFLLSSHARKICSYVPDLARSIAGLIFSSTDLDFQGDCLSVLGFQPQEVEREAVEDCIQRKIVTVIGMNERKPQKDQEAAPFLFFDGDSETSYFEDEEVEGEYYSTSLE